MRRTRIVAAALLLTSCATNTSPNQDRGEPIVLSIVGTNDVHGELLPDRFNGGLSTFSGYVAALREARAADGGSVLLIDAGDMWQGTLESNLVEGASVVEAYNALGYAAAAIGNHEFDFGPVGASALPQDPGDDPRGALKQRAREAKFPMLAANILDADTGRMVDWENVRASVMTEAGGIRIGIIGVVTERALLTTMAAYTTGLEIGSLVDAITREAKALRTDGAQLVVVAAHAGSRCEEFTDPAELSTCDLDGEIFRVARALPGGLVDHIIAGHVHQGIAHIVNGTGITSSYSNTYAFGRADFVIERSTGRVLSREIFPPQVNCPRIEIDTGDCAWISTDPAATRPATYEGRPVRPIPALVAIAEKARALAAEIKAESLGVILETPFTLQGNPESPLARLFTDAQLDMIDSDIAIHNVTGGIRATLPAGELTYGRVYEIFPFDNLTAVLEMSGAELRKVIARQARRTRRAGFSGMRVFARCVAGDLDIDMILDDGRVIADSNRIRVAANDFLATGGDDILTPAMPAGGFDYAYDPRLTRDVLADWFRQRGGVLNAADFESGADRRWNIADDLAECG